ncbi:MAG: Flp pilus assembly protein CpaB [Verrucomicrobia bacterium]|nr:Flp pilus assembly protein CpaB [Verrucomicrobiota bacterium]
MRPGTLFLIGAIVLAAATAYFFYDYLQQVSRPKAAPERQVVMSVVAIPARQPIKPEMVRMYPVPQKMLLTNSVAKLEDVVGKWTVAAIKPFEQIRLSDIAEKSKLPGLAPSIPPGKRAITIGISDTRGVAGAIFPGDHVDIMANLKDASRGEQVVQVPLQNMLVLAVDKNITDPTVGANSSLTLCASPEEAQLIAIAEESGAIRVMLRSRGDDTVVEGSGVSINEYLGSRSPKKQPKEEQPRVQPQVPPAPPAPPAPPPGPPVIKKTIHTGRDSKTFEVPMSKEKEAK